MSKSPNKKKKITNIETKVLNSKQRKFSHRSGLLRGHKVFSTHTDRGLNGGKKQEKGKRNCVMR